MEGYFATLKRGIDGVYHHVSKQHLNRYLSEFDFRYNSREVSDVERRDMKSRNQKPAGKKPKGGVMPKQYDSPLDAGIKEAVDVLNAGGIETFESCEGGVGHAYAEPTVRFHGNQAEGFRALGVAMQAGLRVMGLRRVWPILDNEPTGPWWELTFLSMGQ